MLSKIKQLTTETAIYGISTILGRFLNFILIPFYTNVLKTASYGIVTNLFAYIAFFNVIYIYGLESAYFKYASTLEIGNKKENFSTPFLSIFLTSSIFTVILFIFHSEIGSLISIPSKYNSIIKYSAWILFFDALCVVPFAALRLDTKAKKFALIKLINIIVNVVLNLFLVLVVKKGIEGIFISAFIASLVTFILLIPTIVEKFVFKFPGKLYVALLKFGLPYIPSGLSVMIIQVINRPMLEKMTDYETVGIFQAGYRLGIFMMLVVSMFEYAWRPFFLSNAKEPNAKEIYSRVLTYFTLFAGFIFLTVSIFIEDIVKIPLPNRGYLIGKAYWGGLVVVPIILLGYLFNGFYMNFIVGVYIEKKTKYLPLVTGLGAIANVVFNLILIPPFSMLGAAYATLISYIIMAFGMYVLNQKFYHIKYEYSRLLTIAIITGIIFSIYLLINDKFSVIFELVIKTILILGFIMSFFIVKFFNKGELKQVLLLINKIGYRKSEK
jgi:O-antigen/teichoic acid export membrane protein